jgi:hypothetical protein
MERLDLGDPLEGLLHDAAEAYVCDVPRPWNQLVPDYVAFEKRIDHEVRRHFGLPREHTAGCKRADNLLLYAEAAAMMPGGGASYYDPENLRPTAKRLKLKFRHLDPDAARGEFLSRYEELCQ